MGTIGGERSSHPAPWAGARAVRVLLVDDSSADRARFGRALSSAGYDVSDAEDGSEAWARLQRQHFDVVVSDHQMPGTDGIELIRLVRTHPETSGIPVIMVSAKDAPSDRAMGLAAGAVQYIAKNDDQAMPALLQSVAILTRAIGRDETSPLFERALIVDGSSVARQLIARSLRGYCGTSVAVSSTAEARAQAPGAGLVVLDATLADALEWFEEQCLSPAKPAFVIVTSRPSQEEETRVSMHGAIRYLAKPISFRDLADALVHSSGNLAPAPARASASPIAQAAIADPGSGEPQVRCQVVNLSATGALLATAAPIALGSSLLLWLVLDRHAIPMRARVVRVQEPAWGVTAGCGVIFEYDSDESRRFVERFVAAHQELSLRPRFSGC